MLQYRRRVRTRNFPDAPRVSKSESINRGGRCNVSQRQISLRAAALLAAAAGALAPVADLLAQRRKRRPVDDDDDDDLIRRRLRRRRNADDDDDEDRVAVLRARQRKRQQDDADDDDDSAGATSITGRQSIADESAIMKLIRERISNRLSDDDEGGGGGGSDEPNITVSEDGDSLIVLTKDIELAADSEGIEVETGGISYSSGGGGLLDDFDS